MWVPVIVVLAAVIALASLAYPSITVSQVTAQIVPRVVTLTNGYMTGYPQSSSTVVLEGYSTSTAWYPGNPICDPASSACTPQPLPTSTMTYTQWSTYFYEVTIYSRLPTTYTSESMTLAIQTNYQTIGAYAATGLSDFQYGLAAMLILAGIVAAFLYVYAAGHSRSRPQVQSP
jgi:hypothetical protein